MRSCLLEWIMAELMLRMVVDVDLEEAATAVHGDAGGLMEESINPQGAHGVEVPLL
jgi:hypothetical protein